MREALVIYAIAGIITALRLNRHIQKSDPQMNQFVMILGMTFTLIFWLPMETYVLYNDYTKDTT